MRIESVKASHKAVPSPQNLLHPFRRLVGKQQGRLPCDDVLRKRPCDHATTREQTGLLVISPLTILRKAERQRCSVCDLPGIGAEHPRRVLPLEQIERRERVVPSPYRASEVHPGSGRKRPRGPLRRHESAIPRCQQRVGPYHAAGRGKRDQDAQHSRHSRRADSECLRDSIAYGHDAHGRGHAEEWNKWQGVSEENGLSLSYETIVG